MSDNEDLIVEPCENKEILKILNDEPGFIRCYTHPLVDRLIYYFFEPFISNNELYEPLFLWKTNDYQGETDLNKYINRIVKVSGNVTNCLLPITEFPCDHCPSIEVEYNILDVSSIKLVEECTSCENKEYIIEVLNDEPAYIRKECLEYLGQVNKFFFDLEDKRTNELWFGLFPCGEIPEEFREEGLSVKISGKVTNCKVYAQRGCTEAYNTSMYIFELDSIKIN